MSFIPQVRNHIRWNKSVKHHLMLVTILHFCLVILAGAVDSRNVLPVRHGTLVAIQPPPAPAALSAKDLSIQADVVAYAEDNGVRGLRAWVRLQAEPDLIRSLSRLGS